MMIAVWWTVLLLLAGASLGHHDASSETPQSVGCRLKTAGENSEDVGYVRFRVIPSKNKYTLQVKMKLPPNLVERFEKRRGKHGFHVHTAPVPLSQDGFTDCSATGGHFNPSGVSHGGPKSETRHVGDFGNVRRFKGGKIRHWRKFKVVNKNAVESPKKGKVIQVGEPPFTMDGDRGIRGRAVVLHAEHDDLGTVEAVAMHAGSAANGNAGPRLACCTLQ